MASAPPNFRRPYAYASELNVEDFYRVHWTELASSAGNSFGKIAKTTQNRVE